MANTKQQGAINAAQTLINLMQQAQGLRAGAKAFIDTYNSEQWNALWSQFQTYTAAADGSVPLDVNGKIVVDSSANTSHPTVALNKSATQLISGVTTLQQFLNFCQNSAVITAQYSQNIDDLAGF